MRNKKIIAVLLAILLLVTLVACGNGTAPQGGGQQGGGDATSGEETFLLRFAGGNNAQFPHFVAFREVFVPRIEELTNGRVEVQIFDNAQLGSEIPCRR